MLACNQVVLEDELHMMLVKFKKLYCTYKVDGIRCLLDEHPSGKGGLIGLSRKFKHIPNAMIQMWIEEMGIEGHLHANTDGELWVPGKTFNEIQSLVMTRYTMPFDWVYMMFDKAPANQRQLDLTYLQRLQLLKQQYHFNKKCRYLFPIEGESVESIMCFYHNAIKDGHEGLILRRGDAWYKQGRATWNSGMMYKLVEWSYHDAIIIGFEEAMTNNNPKTKDATGKSKRSTHKANLSPSGTLGAIVVRDAETGVEFNIGSGWDADWGKDIWVNRSAIKGKTITYKKKVHGEKDKPRTPIFAGLRKD